ncbi:MAG: DMT family transporter [Saprospiraceae bacterium]|nr:DMT family transporter [Saprospiraceae bacterium]
MAHKTVWKAHLMLTLVALIYGANYSIAKIVMDPGLLGANGFILLRICAGSILFLLFFGKPIKPDKKDIPLFLICAVTGVLANQLLFFNGLERTSPIHAALMMICTPLIVMLLLGLQGKGVNWKQWLGCMIGFLAASYIIVYSTSGQSGSGNLIGDLMVLVNALFFGIFLTKTPPLIARYGAFEMMKWLFIISLLFCLPIGLYDLITAEWEQFNRSHWSSLLFVLVCTTFMAYALNAKALEIASSSLVGNYIYLQPFIAVVFAYLTGKDRLNISTCFAGMVILWAVWWVEKSAKPAHKDYN